MNDFQSPRLRALLDAVHTAPERADLHYLLGAEWAALGRYDQAADEMSRAIELGPGPGLHVAALQLGLLHLTRARPSEAFAAWRPLETLPVGDPLRTFAQGLMALARDEFRECIVLLEAGIRANTANPPLNRDMALLVERVRVSLTQAGPPSDSAQ